MSYADTVEHFRSIGGKAIRFYGVVVWLTPEQYEQVRTLPWNEKYPDATEEQIEQQRQFAAEREEENRRDFEEIAAIGRKLFPGVATDA